MGVLIWEKSNWIDCSEKNFVCLLGQLNWRPQASVKSSVNDGLHYEKKNAGGSIPKQPQKLVKQTNVIKVGERPCTACFQMAAIFI